VYAPSGDQTRPAPITLTAGRDHRADIRVDFRNPPPQPQ
jgi:hypothetical protein